MPNQREQVKKAINDMLSACFVGPKEHIAQDILDEKLSMTVDAFVKEFNPDNLWRPEAVELRYLHSISSNGDAFISYCKELSDKLLAKPLNPSTVARRTHLNKVEFKHFKNKIMPGINMMERDTDEGALLYDLVSAKIRSVKDLLFDQTPSGVIANAIVFNANESATLIKEW